MKKAVDVVVIGGGIAGVASAYYLVKAGKDVVLFEKGGIASGSSGANAAFTLTSYRPPGPLLDMGIAGLKEYDRLEQELECDIEFESCGILILIENPERFEELKPWVEGQNKAGLKEMRLLDRDDLFELEPSAAPSLAGAVYNPWDGHINPHYLVHGFAKKAKDLGAELSTYTEVTDIKVSHNAVKSVLTDRGEEVRTRFIVNAAGVQSPQIGRMVGLEIPITPNKEQMLVSQKVPGIIKFPFLTSMYKESIKEKTETGTVGFYCNYTKEGNLLFGGVNQFVGEDDRTTLYLFESIAKCAVQYIPNLAKVKILRSFAKFYVYTPDLTPILGSVEGLDGFIIASGHNDYGISLGAITGKLVSEMICFGETSIPIDGLNLSRFK